MLVSLEQYPVLTVDSLQMPSSFRTALMDVLEKIDAHHKDMRLSHVFLFGSTARGTAQYGSDLDILLLTTAESEREIRIKSIAYDLDDDTAYVPVQITVRKTSRFIDEDEDTCGFHKAILPDLKLLRRYSI